MRIELPLATWADGNPRAEDDAHTLTLATQPTTEWALAQAEPEGAQSLRLGVTTVRHPVLTLTF